MTWRNKARMIWNILRGHPPRIELRDDGVLRNATITNVEVAFVGKRGEMTNNWIIAE
jgi:hypothetical protein